MMDPGDPGTPPRASGPTGRRCAPSISNAKKWPARTVLAGMPTLCPWATRQEATRSQAQQGRDHANGHSWLSDGAAIPFPAIDGSTQDRQTCCQHYVTVPSLLKSRIARRGRSSGPVRFPGAPAPLSSITRPSTSRDSSVSRRWALLECDFANPASPPCTARAGGAAPVAGPPAAAFPVGVGLSRFCVPSGATRAEPTWPSRAWRGRLSRGRHLVPAWQRSTGRGSIRLRYLAATAFHNSPCCRIGADGLVDLEQLEAALRPDTCAVSA